jgi:acetyl esterase/lipase
MRIAMLGVLAACGGGTHVYDNVNYDTRYGDATTMDIHVPDDHGIHPAILLIHGGAWRYGEKGMYGDAADRYASAGYIAATIDYRLVPAGAYPAAVQDCLCALSFLRANADAYAIDPDRIAVTGYSAGGQLSALVGTGWDNPAHQPDCEWGPTGAPAATIPGDGIYDFEKAGDNALITDFLGGSRADVPDNYVNASPVDNVRAGAPPMLVIHGHDDIVPISGAHDLVDAMKKQGNEVHFLDLGGAGHIDSPVTATDGLYLQASTDMPEAWAVTLDFLDHHLGAPQ